MNFNLENALFCQYTLGNLTALVGFGANEEGIEEYTVSIIEGEEHEEKLSVTFSQLEEACSFINKKCLGWSFKNPLETTDASGCSTCQAH